MNEKLRAHDFEDKVKFSSGATSGGKAAPYGFMTWLGVKRGGERFNYGQQKHADGDTVVANANWLKAFHSRDLGFFQDRFGHTLEHIQKEMQGHFDRTPGGNWGAVVWAAEIMSYVEEYDRDFYLAVVGLIEHPGKRKDACACPRCLAPRAVFGEPVPEGDAYPDTYKDIDEEELIESFAGQPRTTSRITNLDKPVRKRSIISPIPSWRKPASTKRRAK